MSEIKSCGSFLPENKLTNDELAKTVDTSDEWIVKRTGIKARHIAGQSETTSTMAAKSAKDAIENSDLTRDDIDGIIVATTTPDRTFPSTAVLVQSQLGVAPCPAFDIQAVCSGFIYSLITADSLIQSGVAKNILVIGADKFSALLDWGDRTTCVLFGDGAGAVILSKGDDNSNILSSNIYADGRKADILTSNGGVSTNGQIGKIKMQGTDVFKEAVSCMVTSSVEAIEKAKITPDEIDLFIPHQANIRIIEAVAKKLKVPMSKIITTIKSHGNTSAASIPLALHCAIKEKKAKKGDTILMTAMGAGTTWGSVVVKL